LEVGSKSDGKKNLAYQNALIFIVGHLYYLDTQLDYIIGLNQMIVDSFMTIRVT